MELKQILKNIDYELVQGSLEVDIKDIAYDSREIKEGYAFVCLIGIDTDGHNYIEKAIENGASCVIVCKDVEINNKKIPVIKIENTRKQLSYLSANLFDNPQDKLIKIGITGTKGKTSTSWMIKSILEKANEKVGIIGTIGTFIGDEKIEHKNTTPESYLIQKYLRKMVDNNIKYLVMETSSTALKVGRINNLEFDYGIFTNLSLDHVGPREHESYEDYRKSKAQLFNQSKIGIVNNDDKEYKNIIENKKCKIYTYGTNADISIKNIEEKDLGVEFELQGMVNDKFRVNTPGTFTAYNATAAIAVATLLNIDIETIKKGLETFKVSGRCEIIKNKNNTIVIDFAHNRLSMESIINAMRRYNPNRIITVFGCGGGIGRQLRVELGSSAGKLSDLCIITTDNPRNSDIDEINNDVKKGVLEAGGKCKIIEDRREAIEYAIKIAQDNDIILLLGKGHETTQEIGDKVYPFCEREIVEEIIGV